jgi:hypothetical protein
MRIMVLVLYITLSMLSSFLRGPLLLPLLRLAPASWHFTNLIFPSGFLLKYREMIANAPAPALSHRVTASFSFDETSVPAVARLALDALKSVKQARSDSQKKNQQNKERAALKSFMRCISEKLENSSYETVTEFARDVLEQMRSVEKFKDVLDDSSSILKSVVRPKLRALFKKLSSSVSRHTAATADAVQSYIAMIRNFTFEDLVTSTFRMVVNGELQWSHQSKSEHAPCSAMPASKLSQFCKLISNMAMAGALKSSDNHSSSLIQLTRLCDALSSLGLCCRTATFCGPNMRIISVPARVIEAFAPYSAWSAPPILQVPSDRLSSQMTLLEQLQKIRALFPANCGAITDMVQQTDARIANLEELLSLWARFVSGNLLESSSDFSKFLLLLVEHGIETPMAPCHPVLGVGWATLNGQRISPASGMCYTAVATTDIAQSVDSVASKTHMPSSLVRQSIEILAKLGFIQTNDGTTYTAVSTQKVVEKDQSPKAKDDDLQPSKQLDATAFTKSSVGQAFEMEQSLCLECSWTLNPEVYVRICFEVFKVLLGSMNALNEWSVIYSVGCSFSTSQVADVLNDLHHRGIISKENGLISLAAKDSQSTSSTDAALAQPVFVMPSNPCFPSSRLQWTLFCIDKATSRSADSNNDIKLQHRYAQNGMMYPIKVPLSLLKTSSVSFSLRSASMVKIQPEGHDRLNWCIELDSAAVKIMSLSGNFKTKTFCGPLFNAETFSDFWFSWDATKLVFGRGRVAGSGAVLKISLQESTAPTVSGLFLNAKVMMNDPTTDWIFRSTPQELPGITRGGCRNMSLQLPAAGIRSYSTCVLRAIEDVTGGPNSGYPFIELSAEYARSQGCAATTLLRRMMCPVSATPTPSAQADSNEDCTFCWGPSIVVFPCCLTKMCGACLLNIYVKKDDLMLKVGATPVAKDDLVAENGSVSFGQAAALLEKQAPKSADTPQLKCPNISCQGTITSSSFWKQFKRQLQLSLAEDDSECADTAESIDARFVSNAIKSLCASSASSAPFAICGRSLPNSDAVCGTYHVADSVSSQVHCTVCGARQSIGQMKLSLNLFESSDAGRSTLPSSFDSLGYPNITPAKLAQWFSPELHHKFSCETAKTESMVLDQEMLATGVLCSRR